MKSRFITICLLGALGAAITSPAVHAQISLFGGYWDNIARAARTKPTKNREPACITER
jgi:hypothetical protein